MGEHCAVNEWSLQELGTELLASAKEVSAEFGPWPDFEAAAERASRELAAKDRDIAELRAKLVGWDELLATSVGGYDAGIPVLKAAATEIMSLIDALAGADRDYLALRNERDEARECVGRLYPALAAFEDCAGHDVKGEALEDAARDEYTAMRAALAATPEHLRNA